LRSAAINQLVEIATLALGGLLLVKQGKVVIVEFLKKFLPGDVLQRFAAAVTGKIQPQNAGILAASRTSHPRRLCAAFLRPPPDFFMVGGDARGRASRARGCASRLCPSYFCHDPLPALKLEDTMSISGFDAPADEASFR
jgi:hypothetical protein